MSCTSPFDRRCLLLCCARCPWGAGASAADSSRFPPGLKAVEFWKQIFTRYGAGKSCCSIPSIPARFIASCVWPIRRGPGVDRERANAHRRRLRSATKKAGVRSQRGAKEHFLEGLQVSGRYIAADAKNLSRRRIAGGAGVSAVGGVVFQYSRAFQRRRSRHVAVHAGDRQEISAHRRHGGRAARSHGIDAGRGASVEGKLSDSRQWPLAITAYNHGTEGIFRGIEAVESARFVELDSTLSIAHVRFCVEEFLCGVSRGGRYRQQQRPVFSVPSRPPSSRCLQEVEVKRSATLQALLKPAAISQSDFFEWNPALDPTAQSSLRVFG